MFCGNRNLEKNFGVIHFARILEKLYKLRNNFEEIVLHQGEFGAHFRLYASKRYSHKLKKCSLQFCRSQDRKMPKDVFDMYQRDTVPQDMEMEIFPVDYEKEEKDREHFYNNYELKPKYEAYVKNSNNKEFSPVQRCAPQSGKQDYEVFYENEVLNPKYNGHWKRNDAKPYEYHPLSPANTKQNDRNALRCRINADMPCRKLDYSAEMRNCDAKAAAPECAANIGFSSESDDPEDRIKVIPFSTERLKTTRHRLKNAIFSILENGDVCVELLRSKSKLKEMVVEVIKISKNGLKVHFKFRI